ncbi:MAG TPA: DUF2231 domain-containing protein [Actinomycetota bacterium]|nr:DUF2231 domain-containing protein [Actinomycetota bacterium]
MPRWFSIRPGITMRGRKFKGLRGWAGKPLHPPLTDVPIAAYILAAVFDVVSLLAGEGNESVAHDFFVSATHVIVAGLVVTVPTALTGFWDWWKSTPPRTQAWRTANWHMAVMLTATAIVVIDVVVRLSQWDDGRTGGFVAVLTVLAAALVSFGGTYGGSLVYDYGFNVETAGDHPVWHESETDVLPGQK